MKKKLSFLLAMTLTLGLTACGGNTASNGNTSGDTADTGSDELSGTLSFVSWNDNQADQLQAMIDGFEELHPNVTIDLQFTPWSEYWTKLEAAAAGGNLPDIITMHTSYVEKYVNAKMIAELDDLTNYDPTFSYDNFPEGVTRLYTFNDKHYGVPKDIDCVVMAYNKELFDKAGLEYPTADWTWEDVETAAAAITDKDAGIYGFAAYNNMQESWGNLLYQNGGCIIDETNNTAGIDSPESIEAMETFMSWLDLYSPTTAMLAETDRRAMFASGNIGMIYIGNWQLNNFTDNDAIKDKFDIAPLPAGPDGTKATISNGLSHAVSSQSKNMELAKAFVAYLGSQEANEKAAIGVSIPAYNGVVETWAELHKDLYNTDVIVDEMQYGVQYVSTESRPQWETAFNVYLEKLFNGDMTAEEAFTQAAVEMNEILANEK